jgi:hypothetical protein
MFVKISQWLDARLTTALERDNQHLHCAHQPVGSCGAPECDDQIAADRFN